MKSLLSLLVLALNVCFIKLDCNLQIAKTKFELLKNPIFNNNEVAPSWKENADKPYTSMLYNEIDYFYLMEQKLSPHTDEVVCFIF